MVSTTVAPQRNPRAYQAKMRARAIELAKQAQKDAHRRADDIIDCYTKHSPPQVRFGHEMIRVCSGNVEPVSPLYRGRTTTQ